MEKWVEMTQEEKETRIYWEQCNLAFIGVINWEADGKSEEEGIAKSKKTFFESYDIPEEEKESLNVILDSKRK